MSTKIKYTDEPLGEIKIVPDFLPSPAEIAFREESVKVTISIPNHQLRAWTAEAKEAITASLTDPRPSVEVKTAKQAATVTKRWAGED